MQHDVIKWKSWLGEQVSVKVKSVVGTNVAVSGDYVHSIKDLLGIL